jgi:hypothetical protein
MPSEDKIVSKYKVLEVPEFKSAVPPHLLAKLKDDGERYLVEMVSKSEQREVWLTNVAKNGNEANIDVDVRLTKLEKFAERLTNKWSVLVFFFTISLPVIIKVVIEHYWNKKP